MSQSALRLDMFPLVCCNIANMQTFVFMFVLILFILLTDGFNSNSKDHHFLLLFLMMTASDLSDQTKNWEGTRRTAVS